jgi:hypothetical protein
MLIGLFGYCVVFCALMSSLAQSVTGLQEKVQDAARFEQTLRDHGFTNAEVIAKGEDGLGLRSQVRLSGSCVSNISVLSELRFPDPSLYLFQTQVSDLSPLTNIPLKYLWLDVAPNISDRSLSALHGAKLEALVVNGASVSDLSPLEGMPISLFHLESSRVSDLSVLAPMQLTSCFLRSNRVSNISVLKGKPIRFLTLNESAVTNIAPLRGVPLERLDLIGSGVRDVEPLRGAPLQKLFFRVEVVTNGIDVIRTLETLTEINEIPAAMFWAQYDARTNAFLKETGPERDPTNSE